MLICDWLELNTSYFFTSTTIVEETFPFFNLGR